ncbi:ribonuclease J [Clostridium aminobutyricum]|uniref:Ribonuclease J n=1 Tax=Clostridium aminobutyricum TaxID=33953 RepID=A0A939D7C7_CLOAM|nr:ribonuclease J [Clostridium aminobutyricum]MBN7772447.1 ribonuclease J [Clostridium aminobutyricum]
MRKRNSKKGGSLRVIPIGGLNEIGKNMTLLEYNDDILIIDCGMSFPEDEMYGIDIVIPDFSYIIKNKEKIKGMVLTHGHEDHIGAIPYLLNTTRVPIYGTRLTLGLVENKLKEHGIKADLNTIASGDKVQLGCFNVEAIRSTHSVADSICLSIDTPVGRVFHTGDFKIDYTPVDGAPIDFAKLAELGSKGVLLMMCDSTNATKPGYSASEQTVGVAIENIFRGSEARILIATFSSNVHRVQKIIDTAVLFNRKVAVSGRSMVNVVTIAMELGYLKVPPNVLVDINKTKNIPDKELVIITTGSQGEPMSALTRMASNDHKAVTIKKGDMVILSSSPVPGNEKTVSNVVNKLFEKGADVIYSDIADIHVSGHACEEELKLMHSLIKPKFFVPVHGEYRHLKKHSNIAEKLGYDPSHIFILENGNVLSLTSNSAEILKEEVPSQAIYVDGLGVGDVGNIVLRDRKLLSESGLIIVVAAIDKASGTVCSGPDLISRGFVYVRENENLIDQARAIAAKTLDKCCEENIKDWNALKTAVRDDLRGFIYKQTKRSPVILPIFLEV